MLWFFEKSHLPNDKIIAGLSIRLKFSNSYELRVTNLGLVVIRERGESKVQICILLALELQGILVETDAVETVALEVRDAPEESRRSADNDVGVAV